MPPRHPHVDNLLINVVTCMPLKRDVSVCIHLTGEIHRRQISLITKRYYMNKQEENGIK